MSHRLRLLTETLTTPIGKLMVIYDEEDRLRATDWTNYDDRMRRLLGRHYGADRFTLTPAPRSNGLISAIAAYFEGELEAIDSLPTATEGTPFQKRVWLALRDIPAGQTVSYGELAKRIGRPAAVRAVGLTNGANPIGIVVPCHRVIGSDGSLTGYGGGLERKRWLLDHERRYQTVPVGYAASASGLYGTIDRGSGAS